MVKDARDGPTKLTTYDTELTYEKYDALQMYSFSDPNMPHY